MGQIEVPALSKVSLKIAPGEFMAIIGPSGSGKSTLLHILGFLDRPDSGSYCLGGKEISSLRDEELAVLRNRLAGFIFQQFHLLPKVTALKNAELPLIYTGRHYSGNEADKKIKEVGLAHRASHFPNELSGGEQQRVAIARALINEPLMILADEPTGNLDTKSAQEIMMILEHFNKQGKTIIMVTHEPEIARQAKRIVKMRDGRIISDENIKDPVRGKASHGISSDSGNYSLDNILSGEHAALNRLKFISHLRQAISALTAHKMRSILSMLGILIGIASVMAMLALGRGAKDAVYQRLAGLGSNLLMVRPGAPRMGAVASRFTLQDAAAIANLAPVRRVSPTVFGSAQLVFSDKNWNSRVQGVGLDYPLMRAAIPTAGRFFSETELNRRRRVALLGTTVARELFGDANPLGSTIRINRQNFQVIGILPERGAGPGHDRDDVVVIPVTTAMYRLLGKRHLDAIDVEIRDRPLMAEGQQAIEGLIMGRHNLGPHEQGAFSIRDMAEIRELIEGTVSTLNWLLGSIAAISLLVGGIGIMSIMLVSVTERTREIGLRKAIGADKKDIMTQFLVESVVMTFTGGILGIMLGIAIAMILSTLAGWPTIVTLSSVALATTFSLVVGITFGLWPAYQAARLKPIEAIRYE